MAIRQPTSGPRISIGGTMSVPPIVIREPTSGEWMRIRHPTLAHWMTIRQPTLGARICISRSMSAPSMFIRQPMFAAIQVEQCVDCHSPANNIFWNAHLIVLVTTTRRIQIVRLSRRHGHSLNKPAYATNDRPRPPMPPAHHRLRVGGPPSSPPSLRSSLPARHCGAH